jgi:LmbE family N-acetylglucosaminyl deacetylase
MNIKADLMVIAPHTDDAEFGIAGTVCNWVHQGKVVVYCIVTNGDKGTSDTNLTPEELVKLREKEQWDAAKKLGVSDVVFLGYHDQELEDTNELRKDIVKQIRIFRPETVATTDPYRRYIWHRDHRICGQVVMDAIYPFARDHLAYPDLYDGGFLPHKVKEVLTWGTDDPNHWSDISESFETKIAALACHKSQVGKRDAHQFYQGLKTRAMDMAKGQSFKLAEAFHRVEILM